MSAIKNASVIFWINHSLKSLQISLVTGMSLVFQSGNKVPLNRMQAR